MPRYEYKCNACGRLFELRVPRDKKDETPKNCSECGSEDTQQVYYTVPVVLHGAGFTKRRMT
jgi:putative FmdB family regulatory protein